MASDGEDWARLGHALVEARKRQGYATVADFQRAHGISHEKTITKLERGNPGPYRNSTLLLAEQWYGLASGNLFEILAGRDVKYADADDVSESSKGVLLDLPDEAIAGMTELQVREARAKAEAAFLSAAAEIKNRDRSD